MSQTASTDEGHLTENASGDPVIKRYSPQLPELLDNPYAVNAYYREHDPVHWGTSTYSWLPGMWYLFRHRDNARVLKMTAERPPSLGAVPAKAGLAEGGLSLGLSQKTPLSPDVIDLLRRLWQNLLGQKDAPEHTRARKVMNDFFHRRKIEPRRQRVQDVVDWLFDRAEAKGTGRIELVSETTLLLPVFTTLEIMGLPTEDRDLVKNWSDGLVTALVSGGSDDDFKIGAEAIANLFDYFENELADRRKNPADDLITQLMRAENDKELTHDEVL